MGTWLMAHLFLELQERLPGNMPTGSPGKMGHLVEYLEEKFGGDQLAHTCLALNNSFYYIKLST